MVAPSGSGMVMQSSTLPSLRSSFSGTSTRFSIRVTASRSVRQVSASSNSGLHQASTVSICGCSLQRLRRQLPHFGEGRIEQLRAAVAAEHRDRLGEIVERFALDPDQAVEAPRQVEAFGDVVEQIGDAAFRVRRGDDADGAAVGQVPGVLVRLDRAIGLVQLGLPGAEIRLLRQPCARRAAGRARWNRRDCCRERRGRGPTAGDRNRCRTPAAAGRRTPRRRRTTGRACGDAPPPSAPAPRAARWPRWRRWRCRRCRRRAFSACTS